VVARNDALRFLAVETDDPTRVLAFAGRDLRVRFVVEDVHARWIEAIPNDPRYAEQYGPQQIRAPEAWDATVGSTTRNVCIVDTGMRATHEDLAGARYLGGRDFVNLDDDPRDDNGHGTHVAGIAAATTGNGKGIAGVAQVGVLAAKVLDATGQGWASDIASGITWCADNDGHVVSLSLGGPTAFLPMQMAVDYAWHQGSLVVASAGNDGPCSNCIGYPARYANAIAVTCTTRTLARCDFSSSGAEAWIAAPGDSVLSAWHVADDAYQSLSGTSMSAPHVSGAAALVWSALPALTNAGLKDLLRATASDLGTAGRDVQFGYGLLDVKRLLDAAVIPPPHRVVSAEDFDDGVADGWTLTGLWRVDDACATPPSLPNYLGYHRATACDYDVLNQRSFGDAEFTVDLTSAVAAALAFEHWWETETTPTLVAFDQMMVQANVAGSWTTIQSWDSRAPNPAGWQGVHLVLDAFAGKVVKLRFRFDSVNQENNLGRGWYVDNVRVIAPDNVPPVADAGPDVIVRDVDGTGGEPVHLDASASRDRDGSLVHHEWLDAAGTRIATGVRASPVLALGSHVVTLRVVDDKGAAATDTVRAVVLPNRPPVAYAGPDRVARDPDGDGLATFALDGRESVDPDGALALHEWRRAGSILATGATATVVLPVGVHEIVLRVIDAGGASAEDVAVLTVRANEPPQARFASDCGLDGCVFDAGASSDPDGAIVRAAWTFSDGATLEGFVVAHALSEGEHEVALVVTDDGGAESRHARTVRVAKHRLVDEDFDDGLAQGFVLDGLWRVADACGASRSAPSYLGYHRAAACDYDTGARTAGSATFAVDVPSGSVAALRFAHRWETERTSGGSFDRRLVQASLDNGATWQTLRAWDSRDANAPAWRDESVPLDAFAGRRVLLRLHFDSVEGSYNRHLGWHVDDLVVEAVPDTNLPPVALAGPDRVVAEADGDGRETVTLDGSASFDPDGVVVRHTWRLGGSVVASGPVAVLSLPLGTHAVELEVADDAGALALDAVVIEVVPEPSLVPSAGPDRRVDAGHLVTFDAAASRAIHTSISTYAWDWGDGTAGSTTRLAKHAFAAPGVYTVTLTIADASGRTATDAAVVTVTPRHGLALESPVLSGPGRLAATPGVATSVPVVVTATGETGDNVTLALVGLPSGWTGVLSSTQVGLEAGGSWQLQATIAPPSNPLLAASANPRVVALSENGVTVAVLTIAIDTPLTVSFFLDSERVRPLDDVHLRAVARWADGSIAKNVQVAGSVRWEGLPARSLPFSQATGADGTATIRLPGSLVETGLARAHGPGHHAVAVAAHLGARSLASALSFVVEA